VDVLDAIAGLRVVRRFDDRPIAPGHLRAILNAGRRASSSKNSQRWTFIVVTDRQRLRDLASVGPYAGHVAGAAAAVALVTPDPHGAGQSLSLVWDLGLAAQNMILAAWSLGIGSCPATVYDGEAAQRLLGLPDGMTCAYILSFGHPADPSDLTRPLQSGGRRPFDDVVRHERW
jgi:nitroreductase